MTWLGHFGEVLLQVVPYLLVFFGALALSLVLTPCVRELNRRMGMVDAPGVRRINKVPIPRGGGVAVILAFAVSTALFTLISGRTLSPSISNAVYWRMLLLSISIGAIGYIDDRFGMKPLLKLAAQVAVASLAFFWADTSFHKSFPYLPVCFDYCLTVFWIVGAINAFNLIDGLDGIAAGLASISSFLLAVWTILSGGSGAVAVILLIFCASCLGFLKFNFSPAKIFMGDTGSMFLGLFFAYMSLQSSTKSVTLASLLVPLAAIGVPMFDVFLAIWRRFFRRYINKDMQSSIMQGDHDHLHHRILKETGTPRKTAFIIYFLSLGLSLVALAGVFLEAHFPAMTFVVLLLIFFVMIRYSSIELFDTLTKVGKGLQFPHRNFVLTALHPVLDGSIVLLAFLLTRYWCADAFAQMLPEMMLFLTHVAPFVLVLCLSGIYRTFWLRAGIIQYYKLLRLLAIAGLVGYMLNCGICLYELKMSHQALGVFSCFYALFFLLTISVILFERFLIHYYANWGYQRLYLRNQGKVSALKKVLIYGGGAYCRIYINQQYCGFNNSHEGCKIIGIIDDNAALRGLNVYGFKVLGNLNDLETILAATPFDTIVLTGKETKPAQLHHLRDFCARNNIQLEQLVCRIEKC
jgi:UDP-N-acetylmuramyl pentapeptide phosphotransferase/UDP-N-acetylglucosamine-1-phosphate transferase